MVMALRTVFFGTPDFAVPSLLALLRHSHVVAVVSRPDRPRGRGQHAQPPPVKATAIAHGVPVLQPVRMKDDGLRLTLMELQPDLAVVAAYGRLLPQSLLDVPRMGFINVHASLLPRWRGAAPVHRAVLAGDEETGITIMRVVLALDAGPMLGRVVTPIDPEETSEELEGRLATLGATLLGDVLDRLAAGPIAETPQDDGAATYASRLEKSESRVDWGRPADVIHNQIRGLQPWPMATTEFAGRRVLLRRSRVEARDAGSAPAGTVVAADADRLVVTAGQGTLRLTELQPEGRRSMSARDFLNGTHVRPGDRLGGADAR
jgi:methionyl-tRNA formyltransferase